MYFTKEMVVPDYSCDFTGKLKISACMRYMQQTSADHLDSLGLPTGKLLEENMVFLLSKSCIRLFDLPVSGQRIVVGTAAITTKGARFLREFVVDDMAGNRLVSCLTLWLLVDPSTRRILRPASFPYEIPFQAPSLEAVIGDTPLPKIQGRELSTEFTFPIRYSDIDFNNHVNNSVYADFVCDCLPMESLADPGLETLIISFQNEARHGDVVTVTSTPVSEREIVFAGSKAEGGACFEALAVFR